MALNLERVLLAQQAARAIDKIVKRIMLEWGMKFSEIQANGKEPEFDREILKRIYENEKARQIFIENLIATGENYGKVWFEFSEEQRKLITLKEIKLF